MCITLTTTFFTIWKMRDNFNTYNWKIAKQIIFPLNRKL